MTIRLTLDDDAAVALATVVSTLIPENYSADAKALRRAITALTLEMQRKEVLLPGLDSAAAESTGPAREAATEDDEMALIAAELERHRIRRILRSLAWVNVHAHWRRTHGRFTLEEWYAKCEEFDWRCFSCGMHVADVPLTVGHAESVKHGGSNHISNIVPLCERCNRELGSRIPKGFRAYLDSGASGGGKA